MRTYQLLNKTFASFGETSSRSSSSSGSLTSWTPNIFYPSICIHLRFLLRIHCFFLSHVLNFNLDFFFFKIFSLDFFFFFFFSHVLDFFFFKIFTLLDFFFFKIFTLDFFFFWNFHLRFLRIQCLIECQNVYIT